MPLAVAEPGLRPRQAFLELLVDDLGEIFLTRFLFRQTGIIACLFVGRDGFSMKLNETHACNGSLPNS